MKTTYFAKAWFLLAVAICLTSKLQASTIIYIFSGMGSGQLGSSTFSNVPFTLTATADTSQITQLGLALDVVNQTATVFVTGIGTAAITDETDTHELQSLQDPWIYLGDLSNYRGIMRLTEYAPAAIPLASYDMASPLAPVGGTPEINTPQSGGIFPTTLGNFSFTSVSSVSFQAEIPEPSMAALLIAVIFAVWIVRSKISLVA